MPLTLNTPAAINDTVNAVKINSFAVDMDRREIHLAYSELNGSDQVIAQKGITIVDPDFTTTITDASANAGVDIYTPLKASLYNQIKLATSIAGVVD